MELDLKITGGIIVDGSGQPRFRGDVGVKDGRIVAIGDISGAAPEEIDATAMIVAPGFIDCHTHYDAQLAWDPMLSPSVYHGVTTVLCGNCGFTLAPLSGKTADLDYLLAMLSRVEGMPLASLQATIDPSWRSFGEFLDRVDGTLAINTAFMAGHSALRRHVMGDRAVGHTATDAEIAAMADLLRQSLAGGCTGFSTTTSISHSDHNGDPVPSRWASDAELLALCTVVRDYEGTWIEINAGSPDWQRQKELLTAMSLAAQRSVNWNLLVVKSDRLEMLNEQLDIGRYAAARGALVYGLVPAVPIKNVLNFRTGMLLEMLEGWHDFIHAPHEEKLRIMRDPEARRRLEQGLKKDYSRSGMTADFGDMLIEHVRPGKNAQWIGRTVAEYAESIGRPTFDALFDLAIEEELEIAFSPPAMGADDEAHRLRAQVWRDEHCLIGGSDAGAHIDAINTFAVSTQLLGDGVRRRGLISLEYAVRRLTADLADVFGIRDRGRIALGAAADIVIFDPDTVDCGPIIMRDDVPGGEIRLYSDSVGVHHVIVNGVPVAANNVATGRLGGKVLRSGKDTYTVALAH